VQRALPAAANAANRLEELLQQLEDVLVESLSGDEAEAVTAAVGAGVGYGAGTTATRYQPTGAPAGQKHRVPGKVAPAPSTAPVAVTTSAVAAGAAKGGGGTGVGGSVQSALTGKRRAYVKRTRMADVVSAGLEPNRSLRFTCRACVSRFPGTVHRAPPPRPRRRPRRSSGRTRLLRWRCAAVPRAPWPTQAAWS